MRYILLLFVFFMIKSLYGQEKEKIAWQLQTVRIGANIAPYLSPLIGNSARTGVEINADAVFNSRYFIDVALGTQSNQINVSAYDYESRGSYIKVGFNNNLLFDKKNPKNNQDQDGIFFGIGLGASSFSQNLNYRIQNNYWGTGQYTFTDSNLLATWIDLGLNARVSLMKYFCVGIVTNLRVRTTLSKLQNPVDAGDIPGFGLNDNGYNFHAGYVLLFQIPVKQKQKQK
ncbi:MAG: hypothetical protein EAZ55_07945 [Cytophagales bacterium]|nr:MAG: hypothetical protein EAZ55_07945 [Cytophagales bacterium]